MGLTNLSTNVDATNAICKEGGLTPLIKMLSSDNSKVQRQAARALSNLALNDDSMDQIVAEGGLPPLIKMAKSPKLEAQTGATALAPRWDQSEHSSPRRAPPCPTPRAAAKRGDARSRSLPLSLSLRRQSRRVRCATWRATTPTRSTSSSRAA